MSTSPESPRDDKTTPPERSAVVLLLGDIGDTTWRMFVPTIGLALGGVYLDDIWGTKPWLMLVGAALGAGIAGLLIKQQLQRVNTR